MKSYVPLLLALCLALSACAPADPADTADMADPSDDAASMIDWQTMRDSTDRVAVVDGFSGPEAVRYDPDQDVYFVANFNGPPAGDANGFISRVSADGTIEDLRFMVGTDDAPLHGPRGMYISGDTLWAADADGLQGFDRRTGEHLAFVDFTSFEPGFLNDVVRGSDGAIYVTDTGASRLYRMAGGAATLVVEDTLLGPPNGIAWDPDAERLVFAPWGGNQTFRSMEIGSTELTEVATSGGGNFDGIEIVDGRILVASQMDSSLRVIENGVSRPLVKVPGRPADIGFDTRRMHVAVPYIALDRVDIWALGAG